MKITKARLGMPLLAAALIGISTFTTQGGQVDWIVCDDILGNLHDTTFHRGVGHIYGATFYLIPFSGFENEHAQVDDGLNGSPPMFDESMAFASLTLDGWNLSYAAPSITSLAPNGKVDLDSLPAEFFLLAFIHYAAPQPGTFYGTTALIPGPNMGTSFTSDSFQFYDDNLYQLSSSDPPDWPWAGIPQTYIIIPEPTTGLLAVIGAATLLLRRRRKR